MAWKLKEYDDSGIEFRAFIAEDGGVWIFTIQKNAVSGIHSTYHKQAIDLMRSVPKYHFVDCGIDFNEVMNLDVLHGNRKRRRIGVIVENAGHECKGHLDAQGASLRNRMDEWRNVIYWDESAKNVFYQFLRKSA